MRIHKATLAERVREHEEAFELARRYVFQNSSFFVSATDDEMQPIYPWLGPLESVNSVVLPPCFGSPEIFMTTCALGYGVFSWQFNLRQPLTNSLYLLIFRFSKILVLCETGQIIHNFVDAPHSPGGIRSAIWKKLLGIGNTKSFEQRRLSPIVEYLVSGFIILGLPPSMHGGGLQNDRDALLETQSSSDAGASDSDSDFDETDLIIRVL